MEISYILKDILKGTIIFLSLFVGVYLSKIAKEEIRPGRKIFNFLRKIFFILTVIFMVFFDFGINNSDKSSVNETFFIGFLMLLCFFIFRNKEYVDVLVYIMFGIILYINQSIVISSIMILYGFLQGTLICHLNNYKVRNSIKEIILRYIWFLIVFVGLMLT